MPLDQFAQRNAHRLLDIAWPLDMTGDTKELRARIVGAPDAGKPRGTASQYVRHLRNRLDVVHRGRAAIESHIGRERRLEARLALLALETFEQCGFFTANIGAGTMMDVEIEIPAVPVVLADELRLIGLVDGGLQALALTNELAADVDVAGVRRHGGAGNQTALDQEMRFVPHDLAILAGAGLGFIRI